MTKSRTPVLQNTPETALGAWCRDRSEGVRKGFRTALKSKKVLGVGSLVEIMEISFAEFGLLLADYVDGHVYRKGTLCTWASVERHERMPAGWFKRYWMPHKVEVACKRLIRDLVRLLSRGKMRARVSGTHHWRVEVVRA